MRSVSPGVLRDLVLADNAPDGCPSCGAELLHCLAGLCRHDDGLVGNDDVAECDLDGWELSELLPRFFDDAGQCLFAGFVGEADALRCEVEPLVWDRVTGGAALSADR
ncbi:hypothetical protein GCM10010169_63870 [Micromonospora fulviviridis]|nr:hypothetical protein GCM10010169_63870 [Micromonospora fulviviridis]